MKKLIFNIAFDILVFFTLIWVWRAGHEGIVILSLGFRVLLLSILSTINEAIYKLDKGESL